MTSRFMSVVAAVTMSAALLVVPGAADAAPATPAVPLAAARVVPPKNLEATSTKVEVPMRDGVKIKGTVSIPTGPVPAGGWPVMVLGGTFSGTITDTTVFGAQIAKRGYVAIAYYHRGFGGSGGEVGAGGPEDVHDMSDLITWMLANTPADPKRIGIGGLSYGAGVSMIAGMQDHRVKGVMSLSGWADLTDTLYPNKTGNTVSIQVLYAICVITGVPSPEIEEAFTALTAGDFTAGLVFAKNRGAAAYLDQVNAGNAPALFVSEGMNETVFPILTTTKFWQDYPGRKRIELRAGDHGGPEYASLVGIAGDSWLSGMRWLDNTVAGYDTSMLKEPPVLVVPRSNMGAHPAETGTTTLNGPRARHLFLASQAPAFLSNDAGTLTAAAGARSTTLHQGDEWIVRNGLPIFSYGPDSAVGIPPLVALGLVDPKVTGIFRTAPLTAPLKLRGELRTHLQLTPSAARGTVVVHLMHTDLLGNTFAVAHQPYSWDSATPGKAFTADFSLPYNAYDFPPGDRLVVTVSTSDTNYAGSNLPGSSVVVGPRSYVDVPLK